MICYIIYLSKDVIIATYNMICDIILGGEKNMNWILLSVDLTDLTFNSIIEFFAVLIVGWFIIKNLMEMRDTSLKGLTRKQGWDKAARVIEEKEKKWDEGLNTVQSERDQIKEQFDKRLNDIEKQIGKNHQETEQKIQDVSAGLLVLTECSRAILDGLHQLNCNGKVTEASDKLDKYLVSLVGK